MQEHLDRPRYHGHSHSFSFTHQAPNSQPNKLYQHAQASFPATGSGSMIGANQNQNAVPGQNKQQQQQQYPPYDHHHHHQLPLPSQQQQPVPPLPQAYTQQRHVMYGSPQVMSSHGSSASISGPFGTMSMHPTHPQQHHPQHQQGQYLPRRSAYFESHWPLYSADWSYSQRTNTELIGVSTFTEDATNRIQVLQVGTSADAMSGMPTLELQNTAETAVPYPITKLGWEPEGTGGANGTIKMVSTSDCLRLWDYDVNSCKLQQRSALINKSKSEFMPPLTSFDWNEVNPALVITSSIDTTCTIWDIGASAAKTQLIAHDSEVYDCTFVTGSTDIFTSVGQDGSVRVFDLRALDHSTIIYEPAKPVPLVKVASDPFDRNILATLAADSNKITILDIRSPQSPMATLEEHSKPVNSIAWCPPANTKASQNQRHLLASGGDDCQVLMWDLTTGTNAAPHYPLQSAYTDSAEVNYVTWNTVGDWLGVVSGRGIQGVKLPAF